MSVSALAASRPASPSVSGVGAARPAYFKNLSNAGISALTAKQIGVMQPVEMAALRTTQIGAFNPSALASGLLTYQNNTGAEIPTAVISGLSDPQIKAFSAPLLQSVLPSLSSVQLGAITGSQIGDMPASSVAALKPAQIAALNPSALASGLESYVSNKQVIPAKIIASLGSAQITQFSASLVSATLPQMSSTQINAFTLDQVRGLSATQITSLGAQKTAALSAAWLNKLSSDKFQALGTAFAKGLTKTQIAGLDTAHVKDLSEAQVASLSTAQIGVLNGSQIAAIDPTDIKAMSTIQFSSFTKTQLQALTVGQIGQVDGFKIRAISAKNFASLYTDQVAAFTTKAIANIGGNQIAAMTADQISKGLDAAKVGALSASRMRYFKPTQISAMTHNEVNAMSLDTTKTLYDAQLRAFTGDQLAHLSEEKIGWLVGKKPNFGFTAQQKDAILARKTAFDDNAAPTIAHVIEDQSTNEGENFSFTVPLSTFTDADGAETLSYTATRVDGSALPSWLQFEADTRTFSGTPGNGDPGVLHLKVIATNQVDVSVSSAFSLTVANINDMPTGSVSITGTPTQGQTLTAGNSLADADGLGTISYQWLADGSDITGATTMVLNRPGN